MMADVFIPIVIKTEYTGSDNIERIMYEPRQYCMSCFKERLRLR